MRLRKSFVIVISSSLVVALLGMALLLWKVGYFAEDSIRITEQDLLAAAGRLHRSAPTVQSLPEPIEPGRAVRLAIGNTGMPGESESQTVGDLVIANLNGAAGLELIERQALDKIVSELQLNARGLVRASDAVRAGQLLRADWFLLGTPAVVNGSNVAVVRLVDARTGVMREAAMIPRDVNVQMIASNLATFVRQSRQDAANPRLKTYLAVGGLEDISLNSRQADLPQQLRSYLIAAYQGSAVTLLEREFVNLLLKELHLDLAGLAENQNNPPQPMQAAYWMVDGVYQSYETTNMQIELALDVRRALGRGHRLEFRERSNEDFFRAVKAGIDRIIAQDKQALVFSRLTESKSLLQKGKELARISGDFWSHAWVSYEGYSRMAENEMARRRRNAIEAVRCFETVLLLEPLNREARVSLATCFRKTLIERLDEAREQYRHVIDESASDEWSEIARQGLVRSFEWPNPSSSKLHWFQHAVKGTTNPAAIAFYETQAKRAAEEAIIVRGNSTEAEVLAEKRLFERFQSFDRMLRSGSGTYSASMGMDAFLEVLGNDREKAGRRLAGLYPRIRADFPVAAPYLLASIITFQTDTNASIFDEFSTTLDWCVENADQLPNRVVSFWVHLRSTVYYWANDHGFPAIALKALETIARATALDSEDERKFGQASDRLAMAFQLMACQKWSNALPIFETFGNRPYEMGNRGPWGPAFTVILPNKQAALCREKLGLPKLHDPREFELGQPCIHFHHPRRYSSTSGDNPLVGADWNGLWIAFSGELMRVDFDLKTNSVTRMPLEGDTPASAIHIGPLSIWIGTAGGGIVEFERATQKVRMITEKEGLLMNHISGLWSVGDTLWIGYGNAWGGGLGKYDIKSRTITSFRTSSLGDITDATQPPRTAVTHIRPGADADIWFKSGAASMRYRTVQNTWEARSYSRGESLMCYEIGAGQLFEGIREELVSLTIETKTHPRATNSIHKAIRVVSVQEADSIRTTLATNRSGQYVTRSASGGLPPPRRYQSVFPHGPTRTPSSGKGPASKLSNNSNARPGTTLGWRARIRRSRGSRGRDHQEDCVHPRTGC
ncbi:MAG TPA: hypothetical protein VEH04_16320 [Verrucomicrobiae bacterium]|nr:hypothetical protein [Verrucomicrobiae bacterium]